MGLLSWFKKEEKPKEIVLTDEMQAVLAEDIAKFKRHLNFLNPKIITEVTIPQSEKGLELFEGLMKRLEGLDLESAKKSVVYYRAQLELCQEAIANYSKEKEEAFYDSEYEKLPDEDKIPE